MSQVEFNELKRRIDELRERVAQSKAKRVGGVGLGG